MMRNRRIMVLVDLASGVAALVALYALGDLSVDYELALQFTVVLFLLDLLDLWMPYGEPVPVDSAIVITALVLSGPYTALLASTAARLAVYAARRNAYRPEQIADLLARRIVAIAGCALLLAVPSIASMPQLGRSLTVGTAFIALELVVAQLQAAPILQERVSQLLAGNLQLQGPLLGAQLSVAALTVITYAGMRVWGLLLMTLLILLLRQSLALVIEIRQAYRGTIEALVTAIEIQDPQRRGHARRVERLARTMGLRLGIRGRELERLGYAALLHDVDLIGVDPGSDLAASDADEKHSAEVVEDVGFLESVGPILRVCDGAAESVQTGDEVTPILAALVSIASDIDDAHRAGRPVPGSAANRVRRLVGEAPIAEVLEASRAAGLLDGGGAK